MTDTEIGNLYTSKIPFKSFEEANYFAREVMEKYSFGSRKYGDIFYPVKKGKGWELRQDVKTAYRPLTESEAPIIQKVDN